MNQNHNILQYSKLVFMLLCRSIQAVSLPSHLSAGLNTAGTPGFKDRSVCYRVSAVTAPSTSCLFMRDAERVDILKIAHFVSSVQRLLPQCHSQTWTGQGVTASRVSHRWLTATAGVLGSFSGSQIGPRTVFFYNKPNPIFVFKQRCVFSCHILSYLR